MDVYDLYIANRQSVLLCVAQRLGLFEALHAAPLTEWDVRARWSLSQRGAEALLVGLVSMGLIARDGDVHRLTAAAEDALLPGGDGYLGALIDMDFDHPMTPGDLLAALRSGKQTVYAADVWETHSRDDESAARFTAAMHAISGRPARALAAAVDLSESAELLDVGGGSGVFVIEALRRNPALRGTVLDLPAVCSLAWRYLAEAGVADRARTVAADLWRGAWPTCDVLLLSQILHDWSRADGERLLRKAFDALAPGGRVLVHEKLLDDEKTGPVATAMVSLDMLFWTEGLQWTARELQLALEACGFVDVRTTPTTGYWSVTEARRP